MDSFLIAESLLFVCFFAVYVIKTYLCSSKVNHSGMTIRGIKRLRKTEGRIDFKEAKRDFTFAGGRYTAITLLTV
ncbi:MAG: hypothetical protein LBG96_01075 [Tannerella sp.]|jgi:preprotein translocase subunit SecY|nr:hypothetical protein [Tannerella sp.]